MKATRSGSMRSLPNIRSAKRLSTAAAPRLEFETALHAACEKYNCPYTIHATRDQQKDDFLKKLKLEAPVKYKRITVTPRAVSSLNLHASKIDPTTTVTSGTTVASDALLVKAVYDNSQNLVEIILTKVRPVPRSLMQIMSYLVPVFDHLAKITFQNCVIDASAMYELNKILSVSTITDLIFDRAFLHAEFIANLLDNKDSFIKYLSLCGCEINDEICKEIATRLRFSKHAEKTLMVLNLSNNRITDEGAKHLGEALRTNRHLRYLNLADNHIGDDGAVSIFNSLTEFALTVEEIMDRRRCLLEYHKEKRSIFMKYCKGIGSLSRSEINFVSHKSVNKRKKSSATSLMNKGHTKKVKDARKETLTSTLPDENTIANDLMGPFLHPFAPSNVKSIEDQCYCLGNMVLCYLNLSYNCLTYASVNKLVSVLQYQKDTKKSPNQVGLLKAVIEGNQLPIACNEYQTINDLFRIAKNMVPHSDWTSEMSLRRRSRVTLAKK